MSQREIQSLTGPRGNDEPLTWKPWQPPVVAPTGPLVGPAAVEAAPPPPRVRVGTDELSLASHAGLVFGDVQGPDLARLAGGLDAALAAEATPALTALGTVDRLRDVARAFALPTFDPRAIQRALTGFADHLAAAGEQLAAVPGVGLALEGFGGVAAIATGVRSLRDEVARAADGGRPGLDAALGASVGAAKLVGGVALALAGLVPPLAGVAGPLLLAGAALELGQAAWRGREGATSPLRIIGNNASRGPVPEPTAPMRVLANNGARAVADPPGFQWLTGGAAAAT